MWLKTWAGNNYIALAGIFLKLRYKRFVLKDYLCYSNDFIAKSNIKYLLNLSRVKDDAKLTTNKTRHAYFLIKSIFFSRLYNNKHLTFPAFAPSNDKYRRFIINENFNKEIAIINSINKRYKSEAPKTPYHGPHGNRIYSDRENRPYSPFHWPRQVRMEKVWLINNMLYYITTSV